MRYDIFEGGRYLSRRRFILTLLRMRLARRVLDIQDTIVHFSSRLAMLLSEADDITKHRRSFLFKPSSD